MADAKAIPELVRQQLLPDKKLSIIRLLDFSLPIQRASTVATNASAYFCEEAPAIGHFDAHQLALPPSKVINDIAEGLAASPETQSIRLAHLELPGLYPLWLVSYWLEVEEVKAIRNTWRRAIADLRERRLCMKDGEPIAQRADDERSNPSSKIVLGHRVAKLRRRRVLRARSARKSKIRDANLRAPKRRRRIVQLRTSSGRHHLHGRRSQLRRREREDGVRRKSVIC
ncbi:hypothetical protein C8F01DRAFT_1134853 [Mycena amicta]|nr:hypothetical protein C8F01DRAFT_1134853 [Mycena amicta]